MSQVSADALMRTWAIARLQETWDPARVDFLLPERVFRGWSQYVTVDRVIVGCLLISDARPHEVKFMRRV